MDVMQQFTSLFESVKPGERLIVAVDGLSRAGKTTLVKKLGNLLKNMDISYFILHIDDFIVERSKRYNTGNDEWYEYYTLQWDVLWLEEHLFEKLPRSPILRLPFYDSETDRQVLKEVAVGNASVIIVEGVFLLRKQWRDVFDYAVYLDCPREVRFSRESSPAQQNLQKFEQRYWKAEDFYLETEAPMDNADLIISCQILKD
jgi:uridine kinase